MRVSAFIQPCLPSPADRPPSGLGWIHEIKLDGFRMMVRRDPAGVRLITRNGHNWTGRFPLIAEAAGRCGRARFSSTARLWPVTVMGCRCSIGCAIGARRGGSFCTLDRLALDGQDMRREPLEVRKAMLASVLAKAGPGVRLNEHCDDLPADVVFRHACQLGYEGIVSKPLGSPYRSGRSRDWLKMKNPKHPQ
jgi:bifunctional non-homologous end joining protein LigD